MNLRINEEYFPVNRNSNRFEQRSNQNIQQSQPLRNNFIASIISSSNQSTPQQQNAIQHLRNQQSHSPSINTQPVITGRKLDNHATNININSTSKVNPSQRFPIMIESSRKRMNSDSETSVFSQRNVLVTGIEATNGVDFNLIENISTIKCDSARPSTKNLANSSGINLFSSLKKESQQKIEYQLQPKFSGSQSSIMNDVLAYHSKQIKEQQPIVQGEDLQSSHKNYSATKNIQNKQLDSNKKQMKKKLDEKKAILVSTLNPTTTNATATNYSKQISTNDGSNQDYIGEQIQGQQQQQQQQQQQHQHQQQYQQQGQVIKEQTITTTAKKSQKKHRKSASQTFSPNLYLNREQLTSGKDIKRKKKNQLFIYSNLNSPSKKSVKRQLQLEVSSNGQMSSLNQNEQIQQNNNNINNNDDNNSNSSSIQIVNSVQDGVTIQNPIQYISSKSKSTHCLLNNIYEQQQNKHSPNNQDYLGQLSNKQSKLSQPEDKDMKCSQQSSTSDNAAASRKNKKCFVSSLNSNANTAKTQKNGQQQQIKQIYLKKKRVQNSLGNNASYTNYNNIISIALKKQKEIYQNSNQKYVNDQNGSPLKKTHRQTASLINYSSSHRSLQNNSSQIQNFDQNNQLKRQKSEDFLSFINENALKIQREIEEKKKRDEYERQKKQMEKAQLKEQNEIIRKKNLLRYTTRSGHTSKSKNIPDMAALNRLIPWGRDQQKLQRFICKELQLRENQKEFYSNQPDQGEITSPMNNKVVDLKQRRIILGLECLNQLNESAIQNLISNQKSRSTQSVHLKEENKRAISPEEKKTIQEFMANKKKQIDNDEDKRRKDKQNQQERLKLNLENLRNEIKDQISSCKSSSKGGFHQSSNNQVNNQQNSSSKKAKSTTRHVKSLTFSTPQFDNFLPSNSQYSSYLDPNHIQSAQVNQLNLNPPLEDQVFEHIHQEYKKTFNWREPFTQLNNQYQTIQNYHQNMSINSNQIEESINNQNKNLTSSSPQKNSASTKKNQRSLSHKLDKAQFSGQSSDYYQNNNNNNFQNQYYDNNNLKENAVYPKKLKFQKQEADQDLSDNVMPHQFQNPVILQLYQQQQQQLQQQQYQQHLQSQQQLLYQQQQQQKLYSQQEQYQLQYPKQSQQEQYAQSLNLYTNLYQNNDSPINSSIKQHQQQQQQLLQQQQQQQQLLDKKNQIYVKYNQLSQRLQNQMVKNIKYQPFLKEQQDHQAQINNQYSHRNNQIQEIQEELQEQNDEISPCQSGHDIPNKYYHEDEDKEEDEEKKLNESFDNGGSNTSLSSIKQPDISNAYNNQANIQNQSQSAESAKLQESAKLGESSQLRQSESRKLGESGKLDLSSQNVNAFDLYKQTEVSSIKDNSRLDTQGRKNDPNYAQQNGQHYINQVDSKEQQQLNRIPNSNEHQKQLNQLTPKDHSNQGIEQQLTHRKESDSPSKTINIVDEIPTIQSDASSNFQAQYENANEEGNSYDMNEEELEQFMYFNLAACYIQKVWRGYYTRKLLSEFFKELGYMYEQQENYGVGGEEQEDEEQQRNQSTEQSSNSQKQPQSNYKNSPSQGDSYHSNKNSMANNSDLIHHHHHHHSNIHHPLKSNHSDRLKKLEDQGEGMTIEDYAQMNEQKGQNNKYNHAHKDETIQSSEDNIQPLLIDFNKKQRTQQKEQTGTTAAAAITTTLKSGDMQMNGNGIDGKQNIDQNNEDHCTSKSKSGNTKSNNSNLQIQDNYSSNQPPKANHSNKNNLENIITPIDPNQKENRKRNESLQMQEINEFQKSLITLKDFEKSQDMHLLSNSRFDIQKQGSDIEVSEFHDSLQQHPLQKSIHDCDSQQQQNDPQTTSRNTIQEEGDNNTNIEQIMGVAQKYQEGYKKMKEECVNQWSELINDLQSLQTSSQNQIDAETIKKLCQKYENSKKQLIDDYSHLMNDGQVQNVNSKDNKSITSKLIDSKSSEPSKQHTKDFKNESDHIKQVLLKKQLENDNKKSEKYRQYEESPLQIQKENKKNGKNLKNDMNSEINKMNLVLGSQQLVREQTAIAAALSYQNNSDTYENKSNHINKTRRNVGLNGLSQSQDFFENRPLQMNENKKQSAAHNEYAFEKQPFKDFTSEKYSRLMLKKESMEDLIKMREEVIECQKEAKLQIITQMLEQKKVSPQIYEAKKKDIEQWVIKENEKLIKNQHEIERGWKKFADTVRQTKRGIEFMKQIKKIDHNKFMMSSSDEAIFNKILSFRTDSEASESDNYSERRDYSSLSFNQNNQRNITGTSSFTGGVSPNNIKIVDSYQLQERPKKFLMPNKRQKFISGTKSAIYSNSKSCNSWDGNILNTNNSEEVDYDDINDYLLKMKHSVAKHLPHQMFAFGGSQIQQQIIANNSLSDEFSTISPGFSRSHTPLAKNTDENIFKKKDFITESENNDGSKGNTPIKNFEISPNPKQKLGTQLTNTQMSEPDLKRVGLLSLDSVTSSVYSQSSDNQIGFFTQDYENAKKLQALEKKTSKGNQNEDSDINETLPKNQNDTNPSEIESKLSISSSGCAPRSIANDESKKELMSNEQKAGIISDTIIEHLIHEVKEEIQGNKLKESLSAQSPKIAQNHHHINDYMTNAIINDVMPSNQDFKNQMEDKIIPIESCANLNSIKDFLVALAEFIKENFREEFLGRTNQPLGIDPLEFLKTFNITENTEPQDTEASNAPIYPLVKYIHVQKPVVSEEIFLTFNELYQRMIRGQKRIENRENMNQDFYEDRIDEDEEDDDDDDDDDDIDIFNSQSDIEKYNLKLIFDCFNEALDFLRPFSLGGKPLPWKLNQKKLANLKIQDLDIERILGMAIGRTLKWGSCLCGFIPEKIEFPPGQDEENNEYLNQIKEDRLAQMLENEVLENEHKWLIYEEEETDVQLEISDDIFHYLMSETAQWLYLKQQGKLDLMDSLEISIGREHKQNFEEMVEDEDDQKQLLDYQNISEVYNNSSNYSANNNQKNQMRKTNAWEAKKNKTKSESLIHKQVDEQYQNSVDNYENENFINDFDHTSSSQQQSRKQRKNIQQHLNEYQEYDQEVEVEQEEQDDDDDDDDDDEDNRNHEEENDDNDDDDDDDDHDYFSNKNMQKVQEEMKNQKRKMGQYQEIQSKQNEKLIFQRNKNIQGNQSQNHHVNDFGDQLIQEKYTKLIGSSNSKQSSLNSSF